MKFDQRKYDENPLSRSETITIAVVAIAFFFMLGMEIFHPFEPRKLGALLFVIFWIPLLFIHELGHALMAKYLGWEVEKIQIGFGYRLIKNKIFKIPIEVRAIPFEGFVQCRPKDHQINNPNNRYKNALIYFAGPGVELLIFFGLMLLLGSEWMFTVTDNYTNIAIQSFSFAALAGAIINLIPLSIETEEGVTPNDGMGILISLFGQSK